jgi:hypothetical protein
MRAATWGFAMTSGSAGLLEKTLQTIAIGRKRSGQDLNGDIAAEPCVTSPIQFAHAACAERA